MFGNRRVAWHWKKRTITSTVGSCHDYMDSWATVWNPGINTTGSVVLRVQGPTASAPALPDNGRCEPRWRNSCLWRIPQPATPPRITRKSRNEGPNYWHRARRIAFRAHMKHLLETKNLSRGIQGGVYLLTILFVFLISFPKKNGLRKGDTAFSFTVADISGYLNEHSISYNNSNRIRSTGYSSGYQGHFN